MSAEAPKEEWSERGLTKIPYHLQILGGFLTLQAFVLLGSLLLVNRMQTRKIESDFRKEVELDREVFGTSVLQRVLYLGKIFDVLSKDYAIKQAFATRDAKTLDSVAANLKGRSEADLVCITDDKGRLYAATKPIFKPKESLSRLPIIATALEGEAKASIEVFSGQLYNLVAVPIMAPDPIGVLVGGFVINDAMALRFKRLARSDISFIIGGRISASSLNAEDRTILDKYKDRLAMNSVEVVGPFGQRQIVLAYRFSEGVVVCLQQAWDKSLAPLKRLKRSLILLGLAGFLFTSLLGYFIAETVTKSIRGLIGDLRSVNEQLFQVNNFKSKFFSMVTHDIKNPLNVILCSMSLFEEQVKDMASRKLVDPAIKATRALDFLISDLIDFAAIEAGLLRVEMVEMDLAPVLKDIQERMEIVAGKKDVRFIVEGLAFLPKVKADPARITQVLQNICSNAIQYTPAGGTVTLSAQTLGERVKLSVRDTGIGISQKDLSKIFDRFFQAENAVKLHRSGFGLGLTISKEIMRAHQSSIDVQSELGKGTTFSFTLKVAAVSEGAPTSA